MYDSAVAKQEMVKQTELSAIHSELLDVNERNSSLLMQAKDSLDKIHPYSEPSEVMEKNLSKPEEPSLVNAMKTQLRFAKENSDKLNLIVRHLNSLI